MRTMVMVFAFVTGIGDRGHEPDRLSAAGAGPPLRLAHTPNPQLCDDPLADHRHHEGHDYRIQYGGNHPHIEASIGI
jgi:hypothetical protein